MSRSSAKFSNFEPKYWYTTKQSLSYSYFVEMLRFIGRQIGSISFGCEQPVLVTGHSLAPPDFTFNIGMCHEPAYPRKKSDF